MLIGLLAGGFAPRVQAQDGARYDVVLQGVPLEEALRQLLTTTDINLAYDQVLVEDKRAYCAAEQLKAEDVLRCVLDGTGLDFYRLSSGLYVLTETAEARPRYGTLQGIVVDRETGAPLVNAHILLADGSMGTVSNDAGRFLLANLKPGYYRLTTSYLGYRNRIDSIWVHPDTTAPTRLRLDAEALTITPIIVDGMQWRLPSDSLGMAALSQQSLLRFPNGGAPDVARSLTSLVGVRLNNATADLHVQGGEAGEHQFRLDGAPVFIPVSIGGLVGPFSPFAVGRVTVHKSGFGAAMGSQSSGVIQTEHALGQATPQTLDVQVDPLSVNARMGFETGASETTRTSVMVAGRLGLWDLYEPPPVRRLLDDWNLTDPFMLAAFRAVPQQTDPGQTPFRRILSTGDPSVGFFDAHAAARIRFGPLRSLHLSTYWGRRELDSDHSPFDPLAQNLTNNTTRTRDLYSWSNSTSQLRYEAVLGARVLASLRGRASLYRLRHDIVVRRIEVIDQGTNNVQVVFEPSDDNGNRIQEYAVEARLDYAVQDDWNLEAGIEPTYTLSRVLIQGTQQLPISHQSSGWRMASFINNRFTLSRRVSVDVGSRFTYLTTHQQLYAEPRLALRYDQPGGLFGPWSMRLATGLYRQFVNQFDVSSRSSRALLATSRMWLGVDSTVSPPHAAHLAGELLLQPGPGWTLRLEGYYKKHIHLLAVNYAPVDLARNALSNTDGNDLPIPSFSQRIFLANGEGSSYGAAFLVEKKWARARLEARYEYSQARRSFRPFYDGATIPTPWNEPHRVELALDWQPTGGLTLVGRWRSIWGRTWGFRQSYYDFLGAYGNRLFAAARAGETLPEETDFSVLSIDDLVKHVIAYQLERPQDHRPAPIHQLDLSVAYTLHLAGVMIQTRLDLLNVLDRDNVADWRFAFDPDFYRQSGGLLKREERLLLPFTPSLALRLGW
ncbi:MAG: carboxypeptidase-like regulatory domain-containing protein [Bacteroidetes bacterium]|nr:carboxypeptidase-like regulatory domain-containing protein [Bacteroidota bacterium]